MDLKLQNDECPPGEYMLFRQRQIWRLKVLLDGTIFIMLYQGCGTFHPCSCDFESYTPTYDNVTGCPQCNKEFQSPDKWCQECEIKNFKSNFENWTSGNQTLDQIIQQSQSNVEGPLDYLEWIPFTEFNDVNFMAEGGFGYVESAIWNLGPRWKYEPSSRKWERDGPYKIALKTVNYSYQYLQEFLNEVKAHYMCTTKDNHIPHCFGITQNPKSKDYIMVLEHAHHGSLRNYLDININTVSWDDRLVLLEGISKGLQYIHEKNHVHQDLHSGNILIYQKKDGKLYPAIGDLGLCRLLNNTDNERKIFGVMPYIAPEVIRGLGNTRASDIYSFGIIMWEILTGGKPYKDQSHDVHLAFNILDGLRPTIPEGTPDSYCILMQKCWHKNPAERIKGNGIDNEVINLKNSLDLKHLKGPVSNNNQDLISSDSRIHSKAYFSQHLSLDELRGESCQHPEWPGEGWVLLKREPVVKHDQETQYKYVSREYDLALDIEFSNKVDDCIYMDEL